MNARTADGQGPCSVCSYRKCLRLQMPMPMLQVFKRWLPRWESLISTSGCLSMMMCVCNFSGISRQFDHGVVICSFMFVQFVSWFCISSTRMLHNFHLCRMWDLAWGGPQPKPLTFTLELDNSSLSWCKPKWRRNLATRSLECWTPFQNVWKRFPRTGRCHKMSQISQGFTNCLKMSRISAALNCFHVRDREGFFFPRCKWPLGLNGSEHTVNQEFWQHRRSWNWKRQNLAWQWRFCWSISQRFGLFRSDIHCWGILKFCSGCHATQHPEATGTRRTKIIKHLVKICEHNWKMLKNTVRSCSCPECPIIKHCLVCWGPLTDVALLDEAAYWAWDSARFHTLHMFHFYPFLHNHLYVFEPRLTLRRVHTAKRTSKGTTKQASMSQSARSFSLSHAWVSVQKLVEVSVQVSPHGCFVDDSWTPQSLVLACSLQMFVIFPCVTQISGPGWKCAPQTFKMQASLAVGTGHCLQLLPSASPQGFKCPATLLRWTGDGSRVILGDGFLTFGTSWNMTGPFSRRQKAVVLGIRGTTTLSDALTDAVGEATEAMNHSCWMLFTGSWKFLRRGHVHCLGATLQVEKCSGLLAHKAMLARPDFGWPKGWNSWLSS